MSTKFFTNNKENTLLEKFKGIFEYTDVSYFDVLVGYFYSSGCFRIRKFLDNVSEIRILVGISVDNLISNAAREGLELNLNSEEIKKQYLAKLNNDIQKADYKKDVEDDIWYGFACHGLDLTKNNTGILSFIATNNWTTNSGASKIRKRIVENAQIINILDFNNYKIFENAGIQTMIMIFKNKYISEYLVNYSKTTHKKPKFEHVVELLNKIKINNNQIFEYPFKVKNFKEKSIIFNIPEIENVLDNVKEKSELFL